MKFVLDTHCKCTSINLRILQVRSGKENKHFRYLMLYCLLYPYMGKIIMHLLAIFYIFTPK